jgi:hypothetical protein
MYSILEFPHPNAMLHVDVGGTTVYVNIIDIVNTKLQNVSVQNATKHCVNTIKLYEKMNP